MSWREFQKQDVKLRPSTFQVTAIAFGIFGFLVICGLLFWKDTGAKRASVAPAVTSSITKETLSHWVDPDLIRDGSSDLKINRDGKNWHLELSIDEGLQRFIQKELKRNQIDWGGVAVVDPTTGEVLALGSHSEKDPSMPNLALAATFPAASIFKIVTAVAALTEANYHPASLVPYDGDVYGIHRRSLLRTTGRYRMSVSEAFAKSANAVFGKLGAELYGRDILVKYAELFGFNRTLPFDLFIQPSIARISSENYLDEAKAAAGFGDVTLSPLHGALMASVAVNEGKMMEPYVVRRITDSRGSVEYQAQPQIWREVVDQDVARSLRKMMSNTITQGTARRGFRRISRNSVLGILDVGGKTGSLSGKNPKGKNEWFVGYARSRNRQIAIGVDLVSERYWRIKPSELSRKIIEFYFSPRPIVEANAERNRSYGP